LTSLPQRRSDRLAAHGIAHYIANFFVYISNGIHASRVFAASDGCPLLTCEARISPRFGRCCPTGSPGFSSEGLPLTSGNLNHLGLALQLRRTNLASHITTPKISLSD
jgi:hypothetical protein